VMTRLWEEELLAGSQTLREQTLVDLGGAKQIVKTHLDRSIEALGPTEVAMVAEIFDRLVTPSGTKIAYNAADLAEFAGLPAEQLMPTLERLREIRILRPVAPPLDRPDTPRYEIFHDVLGAAILDWSSRYEAEQELAKSRLRARQLLIALAGSVLVVGVIFGSMLIAWRQTYKARQAQEAARAAAFDSHVARVETDKLRREAEDSAFRQLSAEFDTYFTLPKDLGILTVCPLQDGFPFDDPSANERAKTNLLTKIEEYYGVWDRELGDDLAKLEKELRAWITDGPPDRELRSLSVSTVFWFLGQYQSQRQSFDDSDEQLSVPFLTRRRAEYQQILDVIERLVEVTSGPLSQSDEIKNAYRRFYELYYVDLPVVEEGEVATYMVRIGEPRVTDRPMVALPPSPLELWAQTGEKPSDFDPLGNEFRQFLDKRIAEIDIQIKKKRAGSAMEGAGEI